MKNQTVHSKLAQIPEVLRELRLTNPIVAACVAGWVQSDAPIESLYCELIVALGRQNEAMKKELLLQALSAPPPTYITSPPASGSAPAATPGPA